MIDYDKLKECHELCGRLGKYYFEVDLGLDYGLVELYEKENPDLQYICNTESLDKLLEKLRELAEYDSKAEIIQAQINYWTCLQNDEISTRSDDMSIPYAKEDTDYHAPKECDHEYFGSVPSNKFEFGKLYYLTCIKCGEFYR